MFQATVTMFSGHIIVAIFAEANSPLLGLRFPSEMQFRKIRNALLLEDNKSSFVIQEIHIRNLMMPLRASNINYNDLRHIIILGNEQFISRYEFRAKYKGGQALPLFFTLVHMCYHF